LHSRNEAQHQPAINLQIARAYLAVSDPEVAKRTWQDAMNEILKLKRGHNLERWQHAVRDRAFHGLRKVVILETRAEHFLRVLELGGVSTNVYLRRIHNFALAMNWLPWPVIVKAQWPKVEYGEKRAITREEHEAIIAREPNPETRAFYEMCWHLGGAQSDIAALRAEDVDWRLEVITYRRAKTGSTSILRLGPQISDLLRRLPHAGSLFTRIAVMHEKHRAKQFRRRCLGLGIEGVSLHSYRYAWAERAKRAGYPERFAMEALGHNSNAIHRAYARKAQPQLPSLETYEEEAKRLLPIAFPGKPDPIHPPVAAL
jgi:integrase